MANDFSSDSSIYAWWRFEPAGLTTDSKGSNTWTAYGSPTVETDEFMEGSSCLRLDMRQTQYLGITDANLPTGFPLKSTDATKTMLLSFWFKLESYNSTTSSYIIGKWSTTAARQCWLLYLNSGVLTMAWKYNSTTGGYYQSTGFTPTPGKWYHCGVRMHGVDRWFGLFLYDAETRVTQYFWWVPTNALYMGAADLCIGGSENSTTYGFHGLIDEVVIGSYAAYSTGDIQAIREQRYSGVVGGNLTYTNDFSGDGSCKAHYRFESGALTTDSVGSNTLTASTSSPTSVTSGYTFREGAGAASFLDTSTQYFYILDKDLPDGFPLKTGDTKKQITICCWVKPTVIPGSADYNEIWAKYDVGQNQRTLSCQFYYNRIRVNWAYNLGASVYSYDYAYTLLGAGWWYHISVVVDGIGRTLYVRIWDEVNQRMLVNTATINIANELWVGAGPFLIGACGNTWPAVSNLQNGIIDDLVIFDRLLSAGEIDALRCGRFSNEHQAVQAIRSGVQVAYRATGDRNIVCVRPERGCNVYTGQSWDQAFHTWTQPLLSDSVALVERVPETSQSGTVTATNNSRSVTTTDDLTSALPQYSIIRFGSDDAMYMVRAITSNTISLYRPYRGITGSGKAVKKLTPYKYIPGETNCWTLDAYPGQTIDVRGGIDISTNLADGFSVWDHGNLGTGFSTTSNENCKLSRCGFYYGSYPASINGVYNFEFEKVYFFRSTGAPGDAFVDFLGGCSRVTGKEMIYECNTQGADYSSFQFTAINNSEFIDCEVWAGDTASTGIYLGNVTNVTFTRFHQGHAKYGIRIGTSSFTAEDNVAFIDSEIGADTANSSGDIGIGGVPGYSSVDLTFRNSMVNSANLFVAYAAGYAAVGQVAFERYNQVDGDHRVYHMADIVIPTQTLTGGQYRAVTSADYTTFKTTAPSVKIAFEFDCRFPIIQSFTIPCDANSTKTVSVYVKKNSSYGGDSCNSKLPYLKLKAPASVTAFTEVIGTMSDTVDTWSIVSAEITAGLTCAIDAELYFWSRNSGAIAWYDDFEVT